MIHLDTGFLIRSLVKGSPQADTLSGWLRAGTPVGICAVAWAEFLCGPVTPGQADLALAALAECAALDAESAALAADLFNRTGRRRGSFADCLIAAIAMSRKAALATTDARDFARFEPEGLNLVR